MKLYELTNEWRHIQELIDASDGELPPELETQLDAVHAELSAKVESICYVIQSMLAAADAASQEAQRLQRLARIREANAARLKSYLMACLDGAGLDRVETDLFRVRVQKNSRPSIAWIPDAKECPAEYLRFDPRADTQLAYEHWKAGRQLPVGFSVTEGRHLRIS